MSSTLFIEKKNRAAEFFHYDFSQGLYVMLNAQFTIALALFIYMALCKKVSKRIALITSRTAFFLLIGANLFFELMYWPMSNLLTAMTLFFMLYFANKSSKEQNNASLWLSLFFALCLILSRSENSLLMLVVMFPLSMLQIPRRKLTIYVTVTLGVVLLWYMRFFLVAGVSFNEGAFLTIDRAILVIGVYLAMLVYLLFVRDMKWVANNKNKTEALFFIAFTVGIIGLSVLKPDFAGTNSFSTMVNMFRTGGWVLSLYLFFGLYLIRAVLPIKWDLWDKVSLSFILFFVAIFLLRAMPLRIGYGDSGNRYFAHILPVVVYGLTLKIVPYFIQRAEIKIRI